MIKDLNKDIFDLENLIKDCSTFDLEGRISCLTDDIEAYQAQQEEIYNKIQELNKEIRQKSIELADCVKKYKKYEGAINETQDLRTITMALRLKRQTQEECKRQGKSNNFSKCSSI